LVLISLLLLLGVGSTIFFSAGGLKNIKEKLGVGKD